MKVSTPSPLWVPNLYSTMASGLRAQLKGNGASSATERCRPMSGPVMLLVAPSSGTLSRNSAPFLPVHFLSAGCSLRG